MKPSGRDSLLDLLRGMAALLVCAGHLRAATMVDASAATSVNALSTGLYVLTSLGHQAVMVFFVLSGYLVGGSVISAGPRFHWRHYAETRLSRLWTVLLPCLALTWLTDQVVWRIAPSVLSGSFAATWHSAPGPGHYDASWPTLLGNVLFLQTIAVPVFGSNGPLWSLANECWYYVLFPLMTWTMAGRRMRAGLPSRALTAALFLAAMLALPSALIQGYAVWLMGALVFRLRPPAWLHTWPAQVLVVWLCLAGIGLSRWSAGKPWSAAWSDMALGMSVALLLLALGRSHRPWPRSQILHAAITRLSDMSFSLYLCHFPLVMLIGALCSLEGRAQPSLHAWLIWLGHLLVLMLAGHLMWWLFERHTPIVRRWLSTWSVRGIRTPVGS